MRIVLPCSLSFALSRSATVARADALVPSLTGDLLGGVSALTAVLVALLGLNRWRRQMKGEVEYRAALDVLRTIDAARESLLAARRPLAARDESGAARDGGEAAVSAEESAYRVRMGDVADSRAALLAVQQRAFALWGGLAKDALEDLLLAIDDLFITEEQYFGDERARARRVDQGREPELPDANAIARSRVLYAMPDGTGRDAFRERITRAAAKAEEFFRARLP